MASMLYGLTDSTFFNICTTTLPNATSTPHLITKHYHILTTRVYKAPNSLVHFKQYSVLLSKSDKGTPYTF